MCLLSNIYGLVQLSLIFNYVVSLVLDESINSLVPAGLTLIEGQSFTVLAVQEFHKSSC